MRLVLTKKPKNVTIVESFPGFGLIAEMFEKKLQGILQKSQDAQELQEEKKLSYVG